MIPKRLLPQSLTFRPLIGSGPYGDMYGDPVTVPARVQFGNKLVRDASGSEVVSSATIYLQPAENLPTVGAVVTLPDNSVRPIIGRSDHVGSREIEMVSLDVS